LALWGEVLRVVYSFFGRAIARVGLDRNYFYLAKRNDLIA